jgi:hypothetical protein
MSDSPWRQLGLPPSSDRAAVRRRYAQRLREVQDDPVAFQALREAYAACLDQLDRRPPAEQSAARTPPAPRSADADADNDNDNDNDNDDEGDIDVDDIDHNPAADRLARAILARCAPLVFAPRDLRDFVAAQSELVDLSLRDATGDRIAIELIRGVAAPPHAVRELADIFGWNDVVAQRRPLLRHPVLQERLHRSVVPQPRRGTRGSREELPWAAACLLPAIFAFRHRGDGVDAAAFSPVVWQVWSPWLLVACVVLSGALEFYWLRHHPGSAQYTPTLRSRQRGLRIALAAVSLFAAFGTARL